MYSHFDSIYFHLFTMYLSYTAVPRFWLFTSDVIPRDTYQLTYLRLRELETLILQ